MCVQPMPGSHTAAALGEAINKAVDNSRGEVPALSFRKRAWSAVADGAAAQRKAFKNVGDGFNMWDMWCICHILHLVVKQSMSAEPSVLLTMKKMRRLAATVKNSPLIQNNLKQINAELGLEPRRVCLDVVTRWTSTHECLVALRENQQGLESLQEKVNSKTAQKSVLRDIDDDEEEDEIDSILQSDRTDDTVDMSVGSFDWLLAERIEQVLDIMHYTSDLLSGDSYATLGLVLPTLVNLDRELLQFQSKFHDQFDKATSACNVELQKACNAAIKFAKRLRAVLVERLQPFTFGEENHAYMYLVATYLHPCFKDFMFYDERDRGSALQAATKFLVDDMTEVQQAESAPEWVQAAFRRLHPGGAVASCGPSRDPQGATINAASAAASPSTTASEASSDEEEDSLEEPLAKRPMHDFWNRSVESRACTGEEEHEVEETYDWPTILDITAGYREHNFFKTNIISDNYLKSPKVLLQLEHLSVKYPGWAPLLRVALRYFHTPASSTSTERVWSAGTLTLTNNRRHLTGNNAAALIQLKCNAHMVEFI